MLIGYARVSTAEQNPGLRVEASDVPERSVSAERRAYPADLLTNPLDQRSARISVAPGGGSAPLAALPGTRRAPHGGAAGGHRGTRARRRDRARAARPDRRRLITLSQEEPYGVTHVIRS
jgi:hypothetical protein